MSVDISTESWATVINRNGDVRSGLAFTLADTAGTTVLTGTTDTNGQMQGTLPPGQYTLAVAGTTKTVIVDGKFSTPTTIECFGHSLPITAPGPADQSYPYKLGKQLGARHIWNSACGGSTSFSSGSVHRGGWSDAYQRLTRRHTNLSTTNEGGAPYLPQSNVFILHQLLNDWAFLGSNNMRPSLEAHRGIISRALAAAVEEDSATAARSIDGTVPWTFTGTWTVTNTTTNASGTGFTSTTTATDKATFRTPADFPGTDYTVAIGLVIAATYDFTIGIKIDGVAQSDLRITGAQVCETTQPANNTYVLRFGAGSNLGLPAIAAGTHAIELELKTKHVGASFLIVDFAQIECRNQDSPVIVIPLVNREFNYAIWNGYPHGPLAGVDPMGDLTRPSVNTQITALATEFNVGGTRVITVDIDSVLLKQQKYFAFDQTHLNVWGHALVANKIEQALNDSGLMTPERMSKYVHRGANIAWHEVGAFNGFGTTFTSSWANFATSNQSAAWRLDEQGKVILKGAIRLGLNGSPAFTLPQGFRPQYDVYRITSATAGGAPSVGNLAISGLLGFGGPGAAGAVTFNGPSNAFVVLDDTEFTVAT